MTKHTAWMSWQGPMWLYVASALSPNPTFGIWTLDNMSMMQAERGRGGAAWAGQVSEAERGESGESRHRVRGDESEVHDHRQLQGISGRHKEYPGKKH